MPIRFIISLVLFVFAVTPVCSQQVMYEELMLPELSVLVDSAKLNAPSYKKKLLEISQLEVMVAMQKRSWMDAFKLSGNYTLGSNTNLDGNVTVPFSNTPLQWYGVGAIITVPISSVVNRSSENKLASLELDKAREDLRFIENQVAESVLRLYHDVEMNRDLMLLRHDAASVSDLNLLSAKYEYEQHSIGLEEYSQIHDLNTKTKAALHQVEAQYRYSIQMLEIVCGVKLN